MCPESPLTRAARPGRPARHLAGAARVACTAVACTLLVTGCGGGDGGGGEQSPSATPSSSASASPSATGHLTEDQRERKALIPEARIDYGKAASTAVGEVSGGALTRIELERGSEGKPVWRAEVAGKDGTAHEIDIDAASGTVLRSRVDPDQDSEDKRSRSHRLAQATVSAQQSVETATGRTKGTVTSVELEDNDKGALVWSVDIVTTDDWKKTTYAVDATSGKVLSEHVDRD